MQIDSDFVTISSQHTSESLRLGLPPKRIALSEELRRSSLEMLSDIGFDTVKKYFNHEALVKILESKPRWVPQYRLIENLHDGLAWFSE